jgi:hypothetical protein
MLSALYHKKLIRSVHPNNELIYFTVYITKSYRKITKEAVVPIDQLDTQTYAPSNFRDSSH